MAAERSYNDQRFDAAALNEGLMLGLVRQHELTEAAEAIAVQLQAEIAARKKAEAALVSSEKLAAAGRMAAVLAHEINNPLGAVTNALYLAQTTEGLPEATRDYLSLADIELRRVAHITRQTLGFYQELSPPARFRVAPALNSVCEVLQAKILSKRAIVEVQCSHDLEMVSSEGELRQVLANLLLNSLEAVGVEGRVTLRAAITLPTGHRLPCMRLTVADNGRGIPEAYRSRIFEPFFTTKGTVGNGLGLWVSRQIVAKQGGTIQVHSRTEGPLQGTTMSILMPVSRA